MLAGKPFECTVLDIKSTTNECYGCNNFPKCELAIDKIFEEDEITSEYNSNDDYCELTYPEYESVDRYNTCNKQEVPSTFNTYIKEDRNVQTDWWWMN